jgi:hypothetical protein
MYAEDLWVDEGYEFVSVERAGCKGSTAEVLGAWPGQLHSSLPTKFVYGFRFDSAR